MARWCYAPHSVQRAARLLPARDQSGAVHAATGRGARRRSDPRRLPIGHPGRMRIEPSRRPPRPAAVAATALAAADAAVDFTDDRGGPDARPPETDVRRYARGIR